LNALNSKNKYIFLSKIFDKTFRYIIIRYEVRKNLKSFGEATMNIINTFNDHEQALMFLAVLLENTPKKTHNHYEALVTVCGAIYSVSSYWAINKAIDTIITNWS